MIAGTGNHHFIQRVSEKTLRALQKLTVHITIYSLKTSSMTQEAKGAICIVGQKVDHNLRDVCVQYGRNQLRGFRNMLR